MATSKSETGAEGVLVYDPGRPSRIRDIPTDMRPREELKRRGAAAMDLEKLLAIVMRSGLPGQNVADLARELVLRAGGLENLARMTYLDILGLRLPGIGEVKAMELEAAFEIGRRAASGAASAAPRKISSPEDVFDLMAPLVHRSEQEHFHVLLLDARNRLVDAGRILGVRLLDHIVVGRRTDAHPTGYASLAAERLVAFG